MILEIDDKKFIKDTNGDALVFFNAKTKSFCFKTFEELNCETSKELKRLNENIEKLEQSFELFKTDSINQINNLMGLFTNDEVKKSLLYNMAVILLFLDLQVNDINQEVDLVSIIDWSKKLDESNIPEALKTYIERLSNPSFSNVDTKEEK
jgi:hypothetical protein